MAILLAGGDKPMILTPAWSDRVSVYPEEGRCRFLARRSPACCEHEIRYSELDADTVAPTSGNPGTPRPLN